MFALDIPFELPMTHIAKSSSPAAAETPERPGIPKTRTKKPSHPKLRAAIKAGVRAAAKEPAATGLRRTPGGGF